MEVTFSEGHLACPFCFNLHPSTRCLLWSIVKLGHYLSNCFSAIYCILLIVKKSFHYVKHLSSIFERRSEGINLHLSDFDISAVQLQWPYAQYASQNIEHLKQSLRHSIFECSFQIGPGEHKQLLLLWIWTLLSLWYHEEL